MPLAGMSFAIAVLTRVFARTTPAVDGLPTAETAASNCASLRPSDVGSPDGCDRTVTPDLRAPSLYNDRELSFLRFLERVFAEAQDQTTPLLERVKFLAIVGTHLDEFVMVRGPSVRKNVARRMVVETMLRRLFRSVEASWRRLLPELRAAGIHILDYACLSPAERTEVDRYFLEVVLPLLSPLPCDPGRPFPHIGSLGMNVLVKAQDSVGNESVWALRVPDVVPGLVPVRLRPDGAAMAFDNDMRPPQTGYVWLDQVVLASLPLLFPNRQVSSAYRFRLLRESDVPSQAVAGGSAIERALEVLRRRAANPIVAVMVETRMPVRTVRDVVLGLAVPETAVYRCRDVSDLRRLWEVSRIPRPDFKWSKLRPRRPQALDGRVDVLAAVRDADILFHHPFESFNPLVDMISQAAADPSVVSISITLYRTDRESPVAQALLDATRRGRRVRVVIELNARQEEQRNVNWWHIFDQTGAAVFASPPGLKVHAKMALIVRNEGGTLRRYVHLSSGNYNAFTAFGYTDVGLLTCDEEIAADVAGLFDMLCGGSGPPSFRSLIVAPLAMRGGLETLVEREIACSRRGDRGHIILKMNGLVDREVIQLLYRASQAGVSVDLIVRGVCCLRPGLPGVSERIRVRSVVGRFLEHSRIWYFRNGGHEEVYVGSADLMPRNLDRRIEVMARVKAPVLRQRVVGILQQYLADNVKARELRADGTYVRTVAGTGELGVDAQQALLHEPAVTLARFVGCSDEF